MSNKILALAIAAIFVLAGCQREEGEVVFEASFANDNNAEKIAMTSAGILSWEPGDRVRITDRFTGTVFEVAFDNHNNKAHLHQGNEEMNQSHTYRNSNDFYALHPGTDLQSNNYITTSANVHYLVNSLSDQQLVSDARHYDKNWLVCTACNKGSDNPSTGVRTVQLEFHNCMALLKCTIATGCTNIYQLQVSADNSGASIGGAAWVSACDAGVNLNKPTIAGGKSYPKYFTVALRHEENTALVPGDYYIAIWSDYYNDEATANTTPSSDISGYASHTTKTNVTVTPCDQNGQAITAYGNYTVASYSFARNTIYPVGTFPKTNNSAKNASIFH